jgi:hypothetical protein
MTGCDAVVGTLTGFCPFDPPNLLHGALRSKVGFACHEDDSVYELKNMVEHWRFESACAGSEVGPTFRCIALQGHVAPRRSWSGSSAHTFDEIPPDRAGAQLVGEGAVPRSKHPARESAFRLRNAPGSFYAFVWAVVRKRTDGL